MSEPHPDLLFRGKFYWPSDEYSVPADGFCWHRAPPPNADFFCRRPIGHRGHHDYICDPVIRDHSHKDASHD